MVFVKSPLQKVAPENGEGGSDVQNRRHQQYLSWKQLSVAEITTVDLDYTEPSDDQA